MLPALRIPVAAIEAREHLAADSMLKRVVDAAKVLSLCMCTVPGWEAAICTESGKVALAEFVEAVPTFMDGLSIEDLEAVSTLLDKGLRVAVVEHSHTEQMQALSSLPAQRLGVSSMCPLTRSAILERFSDVRGVASYLVIRQMTYSVLSDGQLQEIEEAGRELDMYAVLSIPDATAELMCACKRRHIILSCPVRFDMNEGPIWNPYESSRPSMDMIETFVKTLRTDRTDRLFTTVVTDESGVALGLVYSNMDSIRASLDSGRGVYWSRSRGELWRKGETSGSWQTLLSITADCDSDAIRFMVIQHGDPPAFCHLGTRTCWGEGSGLQHLQHTLEDRLRHAPEGSYTKRLFEHPELLRAKLLEEVQELVEAQNPDHIAAEAADVTYFMLTRCVAAGVTIHDIARHLNKRSHKVKRREGNSKAHRIEAAERVLKRQHQSSESAV